MGKGDTRETRFKALHGWVTVAFWVMIACSIYAYEKLSDPLATSSSRRGTECEVARTVGRVEMAAPPVIPTGLAELDRKLEGDPLDNHRRTPFDWARRAIADLGESGAYDCSDQMSSAGLILSDSRRLPAKYRIEMTRVGLSGDGGLAVITVSRTKDGARAGQWLYTLERRNGGWAVLRRE